jgi:phenylalanyl-tRNA synthetase alpha chain
MLEAKLTELERAAQARIAAAATPQDLEAVRVEVLGRKGALAEASKQMGRIPPEERARAGRLLNSVKQALEAAFEARHAQFAEAALKARLDAEWLDLTLPAPGPPMGHLHPITRIQNEIEDLFISMGFTVLDGPEVETEFHNFDALNIPARSSGARHAGYVLAGPDGSLLRTHTSPVQVRGLETAEARRCA